MTTKAQTRVLLIEDNQLTRLGIRSLLETKDTIQIVGEAEHGGQVLALYQQTKPDVVISDLRMPHFDGVRTIGMLKRHDPGVRILRRNVRQQPANKT